MGEDVGEKVGEDVGENVLTCLVSTSTASLINTIMVSSSYYMKGTMIRITFGKHFHVYNELPCKPMNYHVKLFNEWI